MSIKEFISIVTPLVLTLIVSLGRQLVVYIKTNAYNLELHSVFNSLSFAIERLETWRDCSINRIVFIDALSIGLSVWKKELETFVASLKKRKLTRSEMRSEFSNLILEISQKIHKERLLSNIPEKVIIHMSKKENILMDKVAGEIAVICTDSSIPKVYTSRAILDTIRALLSELSADWYEIIYRTRYNGYFKGVAYKEIPVNDDEFENLIKKLKNE